jgi:hypothetical protein
MTSCERRFFARVRSVTQPAHAAKPPISFVSLNGFAASLAFLMGVITRNRFYFVFSEPEAFIDGKDVGIQNYLGKGT